MSEHLSQELIALFASGSASPAEREQVEAHVGSVNGCPSCLGRAVEWVIEHGSDEQLEVARRTFALVLHAQPGDVTLSAHLDALRAEKERRARVRPTSADARQVRRDMFHAAEELVGVWARRAQREGDTSADVLFLLLDTNDRRWMPLLPGLADAVNTRHMKATADEQKAAASLVCRRPEGVALGVLNVVRARLMPLLSGPFSDVALTLAIAPEDGRYLALVLAVGGSSVFPLGRAPKNGGAS